jgi:hypothetical protein
MQYTRVKLFRGQVWRREGPREQMPRGLSSVRLAATLMCLATLSRDRAAAWRIDYCAKQ